MIQQEKRTFDILLAVVGLIIASVPAIIISILIKIDSPGPIFFLQMRVGRYGHLFQCVKFRTMLAQSEKHGTVTKAGDSRITRLGRFLRKYKLDEIPQFWNILIGNMSFVGPRPDVPGYTDKLQGEDRRILKLLPGITGPATLKFISEETLLAQTADPQRYNDEIIFPEKVRLNLKYMDSWSFEKDIGYILLTIIPGLTKKTGLDKRLGLEQLDI